MAKMKVRARAVDMLGRQQITGIPTAIHELFKNAHDAYADNVDVDYFRKDELFILRDDGIGMSRNDFETKWLTLGTESKVNANTETSFVPRGKTRRVTMGEKGIGRLAIATIGRQVLVMTRALRENGLSDLTVALIHWKLFEIPGIDLSDIDIPILDIPAGQLPSIETINSLKASIKTNVTALGTKVSDSDAQIIDDDLNKLSFSPDIIANHLAGPSLTNGSGTHFYILPTDTILQNDIDAESEDEASNIQKMLLGFSNTMFGGSQIVMRTSFKDHLLNGAINEMIGGETFFTPEEFDIADQHVEGSFDEFGQFTGKVSIYHQPEKSHVIHWPNSNGMKTACGPFKIRFAYLQGEPKESLVPIDKYGGLFAKGTKFGGLYIYRDGVRVLPYGRADSDFLEIERRRSKSASDAFFSYRRIFGAIEITHDKNPLLIEKAGREGFRENIAFRQMKEILINFLKQLVLDFFRDISLDSEFFDIKNELKREAELLKKREKLVSERKRSFSDALNKFFTKLEKGEFVREANFIRELIHKELEAIKEIADPNLAANELLKTESLAKEKISSLVTDITLSRPRGVGMSRNVIADWDSYQKNKIKLDEELIRPLEKELDELITHINDSHVGLNRRVRVAHQLDLDKKLVQRKGAALKREVNDQLSLFQSELQDVLTGKLKSLNTSVANVLIDFERSSTAELSEKDLHEKQLGWEGSIEQALEETESYLSGLRDQMKDLTQSLQEGDMLGGETLAALENKSESYKEQVDRYFEFAQVGMALGVVQHEFSTTVKRIKSCISDLRPWAEGTTELNPLYSDIRHNFEHLESYLEFFTPLNRRLHRKAKDLNGQEIVRYLVDVFEDRLNRHEIKLITTLNFSAHTVNAYPSTILPVFVNLVDNAIHWLNYANNDNKEIYLDATDEGYIVSNNGPGIAHRDADQIFNFGVTRKSNGRGMGLYISREALNRDGFDLKLLTSGEEENPQFLITTTNKNSIEVEDLDEGE
ncbi:ATP-binding protein [Methylophilus sp. OH31]|uniref:ATP-binding protein n=1 Tax=Methylophilus sp. OH31 TaxID=1387312 RepID=UPI0004B78511|nr:ATP-binding protein [Methylophilus sp. OH31]